MHLLQLCSSEEEIWRQLPREMEDGRLELEERASRPKRKHFLKRQMLNNLHEGGRLHL